MRQTSKHLRAARFSVLLLVGALALSACNLPRNEANPTPTVGIPFPTAEATNPPALASPTPMILPPTSAPAATATQAPLPTSAPTAEPPQATAIPGAIRIEFATGATAGVIRKEIQAGETINYIVGAAAGQPLMITADTPNHDVIFSVTGLGDGIVLLDPSLKLYSWQTMLTVTQDYLVQVKSLGSSVEPLTLNVITPARVKFDVGSDTTLLKGSTPGGWNVSYVLRASAGQRMDLNLYPPNGNVVLSMYGYQDGQPYLRYVVEQTTFGMVLPATQDYIIQVVPRAGAVVDYSLGITIK